MTTLRQLARSLELGPEELVELSRAASTDGDVVAHRPDGAGPVGSAPTDPTLRAAAVPEAAAITGGRDGAPLRIPLPPATERRWRTDFVGRTDEVARLWAPWDKRRRLTEVIGEPGIGKTRLVAEIAWRARQDGATVVWGRGNQDRLGPYLPFVEMLHHLVTFADPIVLKALGELPRLVPDLADRVGPRPTPTRADSGREQRLLFEATSALLARWTPMLLVIDDVHWADDATLSLLAYLVCDHRLDDLVVVVTARPADLDPATSRRLADVGGLIGSLAPSRLVQSVALATEGNQFFAEEMIVQLVDTGMVIGGGGQVVLQADVRTVWRARTGSRRCDQTPIVAVLRRHRTAVSRLGDRTGIRPVRRGRGLPAQWIGIGGCSR